MLTQQEFLTFADDVAETIQEPPVFTGVIGTSIAMLTDEQWQATLEKAAEPCGKPACDCHVINSEFYQALSKVRTQSLKIIRGTLD